MPRTMNILMALGLALMLSACGSFQGVTRSGPMQFLAGEATAPQTISRDYQLAGLTFAAPETLRVSEANGYYPFTDIVWRGDPLGDRRAQINAMFQEAARRTEAGLTGSIPILAEVELVRFHGVTERTRFSVGGVYHVIFFLTIRDATTGAVIEPTRRVVKTLPAPGGAAAIALDMRGQTEKVRMTDFLTGILRAELTTPVAL